MAFRHLRNMLLGGAALLAVLVLAGVPFENAVVVAVALSCPLMMLSMMGGHGQAGRDAHRERAGPRTDASTNSDADRPAEIQDRLRGPDLRGPFY